MAFITVAGRELGAAEVHQSIQRTDLTPIPAHAELWLRYSDTLAQAAREGAEFTIGTEQTRYTIVYASPRPSIAGGVQGEDLRGLIHVVGYLTLAHQVSFLRERAIVKESCTMQEVYQACGAKARVNADFRIDRFTCFVGQAPTFLIGRIMQEAGGVLFWDGKGIQFARLKELAARKPLLDIAREATTVVESGFMERHEVPWFFSLDDDGGFVNGNRRRARQALYSPRKNVQTLNNMTRALIHACMAKVQYQPDLNAGNSISVDGAPHVVIVAAHGIRNAIDGGLPTSGTELWLGEVRE